MAAESVPQWMEINTQLYRSSNFGYDILLPKQLSVQGADVF